MKLKAGTVFILVIFAVGGVVSWSLFFKKYHQQDTVNIHDFPKEINNWSSSELQISEEEYAILETRNVFARKYSGPNNQLVYLLIVYSQNNRKVSHPPEICYTGSGVDILDNEPAQIAISGRDKPLRANRLILEKDEVQQVSYYWFKVGEAYTPNYWRQQFLIAIKTITGQPASSALIRVATNVDENGVTNAQERAERFAQTILPMLPTYLP